VVVAEQDDGLGDGLASARSCWICSVDAVIRLIA